MGAVLSVIPVEWNYRSSSMKFVVCITTDDVGNTNDTAVLSISTSGILSNLNGAIPSRNVSFEPNKSSILFWFKVAPTTNYNNPPTGGYSIGAQLDTKTEYGILTATYSNTIVTNQPAYYGYGATGLGIPTFTDVDDRLNRYLSNGKRVYFGEQRTISILSSNIGGKLTTGSKLVVGFYLSTASISYNGGVVEYSPDFTNVLNTSTLGTWKWTPTVEDFGPKFSLFSNGGSVSSLNGYFVAVVFDKNGKAVGGMQEYSAYSVGTQYAYTLPLSVRPTITSVTPSDTQSYRNTYGVYIGTKSILQASVEASGIYGSTITKVEHQIDNLSVSTTDPTITKLIGRLDQSGSRTLTTTVTDSRGRTAVRNTAITVVAYTNPTLNFQVNRWNLDENSEDDSSTTTRLVALGTIPNLNEIVVNGQIVFQWRAKGSGAWTTAGMFDVTGPEFTKQIDVYAQSIDSQYEYQATLTDSFGTSVLASGSVGFATPVLEFHGSGKGVGLGTVAPETGLNIGMQTDFRGTTDDGYSRIQITDPEGNDSVILANLTGDQLQLLTNAIGDCDQAVVNSHIFMKNNTAIGGLTTSGEQTPILCMNNSNQVELTWTTGGLKGRVMKELWSGTWSSGNITVPELPYYNLFLFQTKTEAVTAVPILAARCAYTSNSERIVGTSGQFDTNGTMHLTQVMAVVSKESPTLMKQNLSIGVARDQIPSRVSSWNVSIPIERIYGIL